MKNASLCLLALAVMFCWLSGIVLAHGFWSTCFAITIPPYAWYLCVELILRRFVL